MADVSVEFGAKDTGLENALKTVQDELTRLDEKVKGGELSFKELESSMKRIAQVEKLQDQLENMADSTKKAGDAADVAAPKARELGDGMQDAGNKAQNAGGLFDSSFAKISAAFTVGNLAAQGFQKIIDLAFDAARAVVQGFSDAIDLGGRLDDLSKRTGETAGKLLVLENAFVEAGVSADQVGTTINKLQNFMVDAANGGEKQKAAMDNLGISLADLAGMTPTEQMGAFASKIAGIEDPSQRAAAASEVFGEKLGGKLLPLLTEFSPALDKSRESIGSLEGIMDENAATFAAAGDTIDRVKGKMTEFAAGILSEVIPEVQNLGTAMENVDAAGLGQEIGSALAPVLRDLNGVVNEAKLLIDQLSYAEQQAREDTGALGVAYNTTQGALKAFNNGLFDALKYITPFDESIESLRERFVGYRKDQDGAIVGLENLGAAAAEAKPELDALPGAGEALNLEFKNLPQSIEAARGSLLDFNSSLDNSAASTNGIAEGTVAVKDGFSEISSLTAQLPGQNDAFTQSILGTNEQLNLQPGIYAEVFQGISEAQAKEEERRVAMEQAANKLQASVELQIQLNEAIASGNVEEQARVQKLIDAEAAQKRIQTLTDQYIKSGLGAPEALQLATNLVNAETAAEGVKNKIGQVNGKSVVISVTTSVEDSSWKNLLAELNNAPSQKTIQVALEVTGQPDLTSARETLKDMDTINKNYQAAFETLGAGSIEEVKNNLLGIPTENNRQLAMEITGESDFDRAVQKLDSYAGTKTAKLLLESQGFENMDALQSQLNGVATDRRSKLILETLGMEDIDSAVAALDAIIAKNGNTATVKAEADVGPAKTQIEGLSNTRVTVTPEIDQVQLQDQIGKMQAEITNNFTGGEGGPGGEGGQGGEGGRGGDANADVTSITNILNGWTDIISAIRDRLPMQALA